MAPLLVDCPPYRARMTVEACLRRFHRDQDPTGWRCHQEYVDTEQCAGCPDGARRHRGEPEPPKETTVDERTIENTPTTCPCGCGQTVRPGNTYATKGCGGRHTNQVRAARAREESEEVAELQRRLVRSEEERLAVVAERDHFLALEQRRASDRAEQVNGWQQRLSKVEQERDEARANVARLRADLDERHEHIHSANDRIAQLEKDLLGARCELTRQDEQLIAAGVDQWQPEPEPTPPPEHRGLPRVEDLPWGYVKQVVDAACDWADKLNGLG